MNWQRDTLILTSAPPNCNITYFSCGTKTSQCIPLLWVCDRDPECSDGSDESMDLCQNVGECGGNFTALNSTLYSPSYPENYPDNEDCIYKISQPTKTVILLNVLSIDTEKSSSTSMCFDFLEIRDGPSETSPLLGKLCGSDIPAPIHTSQNQLWLRWEKNFSKL